MVKFFSICLVVLLLCSCHSRRKEIARIVEEWKNKEVIFPDPLLVKVQGRDTILPDFQERKYKILNYMLELHRHQWLYGMPDETGRMAIIETGNR